MNRREYLLTAGGALTAIAGGTAAANATRADILADSELTRGKGDTVAKTTTVTRDSVNYLDSTGEVSDRGHVEPFDQWARRECVEFGASAVVGVIQSRLRRSIDGVGSGVRALLFGSVISVDHTVTRGRDGDVVNEPNVTLKQLISMAPRRMSITVSLEGQTYTTDVPVGVGHTEVSFD